MSSSLRAVVGAVVVGSVWLCWRAGGAGDAPSPRPGSAIAERPASAGTASTTSAPPSSPSSPRAAYEVHTRLLEALPMAKYDSPSFKMGAGMLAEHWRRMSVPWTPLTGDDAKHAISIAIRTSAKETQWSMPKDNGGQWEPDARVWNMNEGSWD